jgi:molybdopterin synthase catalytic subunit
MNSDIITHGPIQNDYITNKLRLFHNDFSIGANSLFFGIVRADQIDSKKVVGIEYSCFEEMALIEVKKMETEIFSSFNQVQEIFITHSTGFVKTGEISLFVMVQGKHRRQTMDACAELVEKIKERFPAWKKEIFEDNSYRWI